MPISSTTNNTSKLVHSNFATLKRCWGNYIPPVYKKVFYLSTICIFLSSVAAIALPKLGGEVVDQLSSVSLSEEASANEKDLLFLQTLTRLAIAVVASQGLAAVATLGFQRIGEIMAKSLRKEVFCAILKEKADYFDRVPQAAMLSKTTVDIDAIRNAFTSEIYALMERFFMVVFSALSIALVSFKLAGMVLLIAPIIALSLSMLGEYVIYPLEIESRKRTVEVADAADEAFSNTKAIKIFQIEKRIARRFDVPLELKFKADATSIFGLTLFRGLIYGVSGLALVFACWVGRRAILKEEIVAGDLISFLIYSINIAVALANSTRGFAIVANGMICLKSTFVLLDSIVETSDGGDASQPLVFVDDVKLKTIDKIEMYMVKFEYSSEVRKSSIVLNNLNLTLTKGVSHCLVGPSGSGKTTICSLLEKLYEPVNGKIMINNNIPLRNVSIKQWGKLLSVVMQDAMLFSGTIRENILYGLGDDLMEDVSETHLRVMLDRAVEVSNVIEFTSQFPLGLETQIGPKGGQLSAGQKQRVAIARAIIKNPKILILDEHTAQLDANSEKQIQASMEAIYPDRITLMIAHRLTTASKCQAISVLFGGAVVESGSHFDLLQKNGLYSTLWRAQQSL